MFTKSIPASKNLIPLLTFTIFFILFLLTVYNPDSSKSDQTFFTKAYSNPIDINHQSPSKDLEEELGSNNRSKEDGFIKYMTDSEDNSIDVMFWWENREGSQTIDHSLSRIFHAAVKSAVIAGISIDVSTTKLSKVHSFANVVVFSNSLPLDFFCSGAPPHTFRHKIEQDHTQKLTCKYVQVLQYDIKILMKNFPHSVSDPLVKNLENKVNTKNNEFKLLPNDKSDLMRYVLIYHYGGTYLDLDQMMLQPLPLEDKPLLVQERQWNKKRCLTKKGNNYCQIIGKAAIPASCLDPTRNNDMVLSLFSGVMGNFPKHSELAKELVIEASLNIGKTCNLGWGCFGPLLITRVVSNWCKQHENTCAASILPNSKYLLQRPDWKSRITYDPITWREMQISVLDIDFHGKKKNSGMIAGLVDRMLWWSVSASNTVGTSKLLSDLDENEYDIFKKVLEKDEVGTRGSTTKRTTNIPTTMTTVINKHSIDSSKHVAKLPWENRN